MSHVFLLNIALNSALNTISNGKKNALRLICLVSNVQYIWLLLSIRINRVLVYFDSSLQNANVEVFPQE